MKQVGIAALKARLSGYLKSVRRGHALTVVDRGTPVAMLVPLETAEALRARHPTRRLHEVRLPAPARRPIDSLAALREERADR